MLNQQLIQQRLNDEIAIRLGRSLIDGIRDQLVIGALSEEVARLEALDQGKEAEQNQQPQDAGKSNDTEQNQ